MNFLRIRLLHRNNTPCWTKPYPTTTIGLQINVLKIQQARCLHYLHFSAKHYLNLYTSINLNVLEIAQEKNQRVYLEFPGALPDIEVGDICETEWERAVVVSDIFGSLEKLRILMIHGCCFVDIQHQNPHTVLARIAGLDHAVYRLPNKTYPILFEHRNLLIATTKLSQFQTARYAPIEAWRRLCILR